MALLGWVRLGLIQRRAGSAANDRSVRGWEGARRRRGRGVTTRGHRGRRSRCGVAELFSGRPPSAFQVRAPWECRASTAGFSGGAPPQVRPMGFPEWEARSPFRCPHADLQQTAPPLGAGFRPRGWLVGFGLTTGLRFLLNLQRCATMFARRCHGSPSNSPSHGWQVQLPVRSTSWRF